MCLSVQSHVSLLCPQHSLMVHIFPGSGEVGLESQGQSWGGGEGFNQKRWVLCNFWLSYFQLWLCQPILTVVVHAYSILCAHGCGALSYLLYWRSRALPTGDLTVCCRWRIMWHPQVRAPGLYSCSRSTEKTQTLESLISRYGVRKRL